MLEINKSKDWKTDGAGSLELKSELQSFFPLLDADDLDALAALVAAEDIRITSPPKTGLLMMTVKDSFESPFHLGEILVTTVAVEYRGRKTQATVMGDHPLRAMVLAGMEAVLRAGPIKTIDKIKDEMDRLRRIATARRGLENSLVRSTRVDFSSMTREDTDFGTIG